MYTQCPECQIAFRVTAKVLQQAAGNVRCGSCSHAFNALEYLSEEMPAASSAMPKDDAAAPLVHDELAETSRRLLETLDELAGPEDVRIEDTGVEWRVLDDAVADAAPTPDERRYDDNSPLPDEDYDEASWPTPSPQRRETDHDTPDEEFAERQGDFALSEPEDWTDILEEVSDDDVALFAVEEELAAIHTQLSSRDTPDEADETPDDIEAQFSTQAEALGLDILGAEDALTDEVPQLEESEFEAPTEALGDEESLIEEIEAAADGDLPVDGDDEANPAGEGSVADDEIRLPDEEQETSSFEILDEEAKVEAVSSGAFEAVFETAADVLDGEDPDDDAVAEQPVEELPGFDDEADSELDAELDKEADADADIEAEFADKPGAAAELDEEPSDEPDADAELDEEPGDEPDNDEEIDDEFNETFDDELDDEEPDEQASAEVQHVPEPTAEEMTVNIEIDQEMMAAAEKDQDFTATLVGIENPEELFNENSGEVETIIMEGEFVRSEIERERLEAENAARSQLDDPARLADTYALSRDKLRGGRRSYDPPSVGMVAAAAALALLLVGQYIHNSRQSLATLGFFNQTIAPIYRVLGSPVTPEWDIKGWQFEATNGSVDAEETTLTIVSRLVNRSDQSLPYPLVHVSLTNRFEDIMGSRILEPGEYLAGDGDPSQPVQPGDNFSAIIAIEDVPADATGFKLNVCYRAETGVVRCAIESFKN